MTRFLKSRSTLGVRSVPVSIAFYRDAVGFDVNASMGDPPTFAMLGADDSGLGLNQVEQPSVADFAVCYFSIDGVEALHERCVAAGAVIAVPLTRQPWGNYDFVLADPDGHLIAFGEDSAPGR